jgi:bacillithiol synthase
MISSMESHCLSFREIPHTSKLLSSFLDDFRAVSRYYAHPPTAAGVDASAREVKLDSGARRAVVDILREQNRTFGPNREIDSATSRNLDRLAAGAVAIVTGQQVGLFSGPAYTFYKALSAIRCADDATRRGIEAVPVFWLASEDHDFAEINHSDWCTRNGLARHETPADNSGRRVGELALGDSIQSIVGTAANTLEGSFAGEVSRALQESYTSRETYASAFGKLMARLFAGRGMIFIEQLDPRLHKIFAPLIAQAIERSGEIRDTLLARSHELESSGLHAQVKVAAETTLVFSSLAGPREPIRIKNGDFLAGDRKISKAELLREIESHPESFSPSALLRPVIQDSFLPTAAYIGGPAEIAYFAQSQVVYQTLGVRMPTILPRASFTIVEPPIARFLAQYDLDLRDLLAGRQHLRAKMEQKSITGSLATKFEAGEEELRRLINGFEEPLSKLDATLVESLRGAEAKMLHQFTQLKAKVARAENFRSGVLDRHERILSDALVPHGELQERSASLLPYLATYGLSFLDELTSLSSVAASGQGHSCATQHQILNL